MFLLSIFLFGTAYIFRTAVISFFLKVFYNLFTLYYRYIKTNTFRKEIIVKESLDFEKFTTTHYSVHLNDKTHDMIVVFSKNKDNLIDIIDEEQIYRKIPCKNILVYCSLVDEDENIILDLTNTLRNFAYHFESDDSSSKMSNFLEYLKYYSKKEDVSLDFNNLENYYLMIYMNDDEFTEYKYKLSDILEKNYRDLLVLK